MATKCPKCGDALIWDDAQSRYFCVECEDHPVAKEVSELQFMESVPRELKRVADALWIFVYLTVAVLLLMVVLIADTML